MVCLTGGKRKVNKSLKAWVKFVKRVQREEKLSYKDAIHRAKQRKDKGEKWMSGGGDGDGDADADDMTDDVVFEKEEVFTPELGDNMPAAEDDYEQLDMKMDEKMSGGRRRRRRTMRKHCSRRKSRRGGSRRCRRSRRHSHRRRRH